MNLTLPTYSNYRNFTPPTYPDQIVLGIGNLSQSIEVEEDDGLSLPMAVVTWGVRVVCNQTQSRVVLRQQARHAHLYIRQHQSEITVS